MTGIAGKQTESSLRASRGFHGRFSNEAHGRGFRALVNEQREK